MTTGLVMNISRFCTDDGPGIRTTVFLKGCPLKCIWCHNPESQGAALEIMYNSSKCILCGQCAKVCEKGCHVLNGKHLFERNNCIQCQKCVSACPSEALSIVGKVLSVDEVYLELAKDKQFYDASGGGITVSGGEPLFQSGFTAALLEKCKKNGIHTAIETSGFASEDSFKKVIKYCDLVLFDIKETDPDRHLSLTGMPLSPIMKNLFYLNEIGVPFILRVPIIPTVNDRKEHLLKVRDLSKSLANCLEAQIMPYHSFGEYKYSCLGKEYVCKSYEPGKEELDSWRKLLE